MIGLAAARARWDILAAVLAGHVVAVVIQAMVPDIRLLFLFWLLGGVAGLGIWFRSYRALLAYGASGIRLALAEKQDWERLLLAANAEGQGYSTQTCDYLAGPWPDRRSLQPLQLPWSWQLLGSVIVALSWQIPDYPVFSLWTIAGPFGPTLVREQSLYNDSQLQYIGPPYVVSESQMLLPDQDGLVVEHGGDLTWQLRSEYELVLYDDTALWASENTNDYAQFRLPIDWQGSRNFILEHHSLGLVLRHPVPFRVQGEPDPAPILSWVSVDFRTVLDEDETFLGKAAATDNHGLRYLGLHIEDAAGAAVTEVVSFMHKTEGYYQTAATSFTFRVTPSRWLQTLQSGVWTLRPMAVDANPGGQPGYGDPVTILVRSRYDQHQAALEDLYALFELSLDYLADRWDTTPVPTSAVGVVTSLWERIRETQENYWSTNSMDAASEAVAILLAAIRKPQQPVLEFEKATILLLMAREEEQQSVVSDRLGDVERAQQDLMAALQNEAVSDAEILQMLEELMQKLADLQQASQDDKTPLPQELVNREAFGQENQREAEYSLQDILDKLRSGRRDEAMNSLQKMMENIDKMRDALKESGANPSSPASADSASGSDGMQQQREAISKAKEAIQEALEAEQQALSAGQSGDPDQAGPQAQGAMDALQKAEGALNPDKAGSQYAPFAEEKRSLQEARSSWQQAQDALQPGKGTTPGGGKPSAEPGRGEKGTEGQGPGGTEFDPNAKPDMQGFQQHGEESMQQLREALDTLQQREESLERQMQGGQKSGSRDSREKFDEQKQKARSVSEARKLLFENYQRGIPDYERKTNQTYFDRLAR